MQVSAMCIGANLVMPCCSTLPMVASSPAQSVCSRPISLIEISLEAAGAEPRIVPGGYTGRQRRRFAKLRPLSSCSAGELSRWVLPLQVECRRRR